MIGRIIDVVRLLGRLNLPFRGHKEDQASLNKGIFREIIEHFAQNDVVMEYHLQNAKGKVRGFQSQPRPQGLVSYWDFSSPS